MKGTNAIEQYFRQLEQAQKFSGVVLITRGKDHLYAATFGYADRAWKIANNLDTRFDTASLTKLFTSVATLQLIDKGLLQLDTRAVEFLDLENTAISPDATVFHLLTHTSGIGDDAEEEKGEDYEDLWKTKANYSVTTTADFLPQFVHKPANFAPGAGVQYCNCSFILLGLMIEKITGQTYRDYVRENIFARAGMDQTDFFSMDRVHEKVAEGSDPITDNEGLITGWKKNIYSFPPIGSPDSGAHVTAANLDRFLRAVQRGRLLSPELTEAFLTPQVFAKEMDGWTRKYSFGLWFYVDRSGEVVCYQKEGYNAGVSAVMRYFPKHDINLIILSNMAAGAWKPAWKIHEMIVADQIG